MDQETRNAIMKIGNGCSIYNTHSPAPRRFKLTADANKFRFNQTLQADTMFLNNRPVLHIVDLSTHFRAEMFYVDNRRAAYRSNYCRNGYWFMSAHPTT